jgi:hypothetical protein
MLVLDDAVVVAAVSNRELDAAVEFENESNTLAAAAANGSAEVLDELKPNGSALPPNRSETSSGFGSLAGSKVSSVSASSVVAAAGLSGSFSGAASEASEASAVTACDSAN